MIFDEGSPTLVAVKKVSFLKEWNRLLYPPSMRPLEYVFNYNFPLIHHFPPPTKITWPGYGNESWLARLVDHQCPGNLVVQFRTGR